MNLFDKKYGKKLLYLVISATNLCLCFSLCGCSTTTTNETEPLKSISQSDIVNMGRKELGANVENNYYAYVNFERLKTDEISYGEVFFKPFISDNYWVADALQKELETIYRNRGNYKQGSNEQKIADCYAQYIDTEARNEAGIAPLEKILGEIESAASIGELLEVCAKMQWESGCGTIFDCGVDVDYFDTDKYGLVLGQMQIPVSLENLLTEYGEAENLQTTIENILKKCKAKNYEERARKLTDMLISVAECSVTEYELGLKSCRKISLDELAGIFNHADISGYITRLKSCGAKEIIVVDYGQIEAVGKYLSAENLTLWKDYLTVRLFCFCGEYLPEEYARLLTPIGVNSSPPTKKEAEKKILEESEKEMAYIFAEKYADESVIEAAKAFTQDIIHAYQNMIKNAKKVDEKTKKKFLKKLENMKVNINIPSAPYDGRYEWIPAENGGCLLANILAKRAGEFKRTLENIGKPFDKSGFHWNGMLPQTPYGDAQYDSSNYVTIPYATLTEPYFDANGNYYKNLGQLGAIIGHEISHGFDAEGMCYDENGNPEDWLSDEYNLYLEKKKRNITELYNSYKLFGIYPIDGETTLGENMADLAGLQCVLSMAKTNEEKRTVLESYAEQWYELLYDDVVYGGLYIGTHSECIFRVNVVVSQMKEFYEVYDIDKNDEMYTEPKKRERMWE